MWVKLFIFDTLKLSLTVAMNTAVKRIFPVHLWRPACRQHNLPVKQYEEDVGASLSLTRQYITSNTGGGNNDPLVETLPFSQ